MIEAVETYLVLRRAAGFLSATRNTCCAASHVSPVIARNRISARRQRLTGPATARRSPNGITNTKPSVVSPTTIGWKIPGTNRRRRTTSATARRAAFLISILPSRSNGRGKRYFTTGLANVLAGGWPISPLLYYSSGLPVSMATTIGFPVFSGRLAPTITSHEGWRGPQARDKFDPQTDCFFQPASFFGPQPTDRPGNMTRYNPKLRQFPNYTENVSVAKTFNMSERIRLDFRAEAFNVYNRVRFGTGPTTLQDPNFGRLTSNLDILNDPRRMQFALKLYW